MRPWRLKTPCSVSFKSGYLIIIDERIRGNTGSIVKSSMRSRDQKVEHRNVGAYVP